MSGVRACRRVAALAREVERAGGGAVRVQALDEPDEPRVVAAVPAQRPRVEQQPALRSRLSHLVPVVETLEGQAVTLLRLLHQLLLQILFKLLI